MGFFLDLTSISFKLMYKLKKKKKMTGITAFFEIYIRHWSEILYQEQRDVLVECQVRVHLQGKPERGLGSKSDTCPCEKDCQLL